MSKLQTQLRLLIIAHLLIVVASFGLLVASGQLLVSIVFLGVWLMIYGYVNRPTRRGRIVLRNAVDCENRVE